VLPADAIRRHRIFRRIGGFAFEREQRIDDVVGVDRLGQIVERAELHGGHRGRDIAVAGEDDRACVGTPPLERRDHVEAVAVAEPHVDHSESGR
jgi:hypothetical protein